MRLNLIMGVFWLGAAVTLLVFALQGKKVAGLDPDRAYVIIVLGFLLSLYNVVRWWASRSRRPAPQEMPRKRILYGEQQEYLPEFDFQKQQEKPGPDSNANRETENRE